jgi:hypothetical protein
MLFFNLFRVVLAMTNHDLSHCTTSFYMYETTESKFVITVIPQNYICPHGRIYPINVVLAVRNRITSPTDQVLTILCDTQHMFRPMWFRTHTPRE